jgi:ferredoxin--NADP+ reductase
MVRIVEKRQLTPITKLYRVEAPLIARAARAGQFVIVRVREGGERIPLTITDYDRESGLLTIVVQEVGATTRRLGLLEEGEEILDMVGPLGEAPDIPSGGHIVGVGGGYGSAALLCLMRELRDRGERTTIIMGARKEGLLILADELSGICDNLEICTDDGSAGFHGFAARAPGFCHRNRAHAHDARGREDHPGRGHPDQRLAGPVDDRRHGHVRRLPRHDRRPGQVRLR